MSGFFVLKYFLILFWILFFCLYICCMNIGRTINTFRKRLGLTQVELSKKSGVLQANISSIEIGKITNPDESTIEKLAKALGVTADMIRLYSLEYRDVAPEKREAFKTIKQSCDNLVMDYVDSLVGQKGDSK